MEEKLYQVALEFIPGIGDVNAKNLIAYCGSASGVFKSKAGILSKIPGIGPKTIESLHQADHLKKAEEIINSCEKKSITIHHFTDKSYPEKLKQAFDSPNIIYSKGDISSFQRAIALVGTRNATDYGKEITERIVVDSKPINACIVSGLAYGIDIAAHRAAINQNIPTVAVLAGGLDKVYPTEHQKYIEAIISNGGIISENPPGVKAEAHYFPARNRIIAGMSDATIVVEAAQKGGALITANIADSYDRPVFAVPGDLTHKYSEGCNYLIRNQKALIYTGIEDLKYHLNWDEASLAKREAFAKDYSNLSESEQKIVHILVEHTSGLSVDEISWRTQIPMNQLASLLLNLEFQNLIKSLPGKKYKLI